MLVVSSREFRDRQRSCLDKIDAGMEVLIQRGQSKSYKVSAIKEDDTLMSKAEFFAKIDRSLQEIEEGKFTRVTGKEELKRYLDSL